MPANATTHSVPLPPRSVGFLCADPEAVPFISLWLQRQPQTVSGVCLTLSNDPAGPTVDPTFRVPHWEQWLEDESLRWVVIAGDSTEVIEATRQLATAGKSILLFPQLAQGVSLGYELSLIADERPIEVQPAWSLRGHPAMRRLREWLLSQYFGASVHLQLERQLRTDRPGSVMTAEEVESAWLEDADLLNHLGGPFDQLTCTQSGISTQGIAISQVIVNRLLGCQGVWSCRGGTAETWKLTVNGDLGSATLSRGDSAGEYVTELTGRESTGERWTDRADSAELLAEQLERLLRGGAAAGRLSDLIRAFELVEGSRRSLARRRTIDLQGEPPTERGQFKTQMTALGCGVLMLTLVAIPAYLGMASLADLWGAPPWILYGARIIVFAPLGVFLLLQCLFFLTKSGRTQ